MRKEETNIFRIQIFQKDMHERLDRELIAVVQLGKFLNGEKQTTAKLCQFIVSRSFFFQGRLQFQRLL